MKKWRNHFRWIIEQDKQRELVVLADRSFMIGIFVARRNVVRWVIGSEDTEETAGMPQGRFVWCRVRFAREFHEIIRSLPQKKDKRQWP